MIVSDRQEVVAELEPIVRAGQHLALSVSDGGEALRILQEGLVPDLIISDAGAGPEEPPYIRRFRQMNRVGRHMVVVEEGAPPQRQAVGGAAAEQATPLPRPFRRQEVLERIEQAVLHMGRDLHALRAEVWRELARMQQAMRDMQRETVNALAATIAARDPYMHGHATRVADLSRRVARALGIAEEEARMLETAAMLHEIGKGSVPLELLHKTEPLSPDELERIRAHARTGAEIVRGVPSLRRLAPIIEHQGTDHDELAAEMDPASPEFLLTAVLRVVDAYDAMVSPRSYRGPMPREYWERTLRSGAGTRFHPAAVDALLRALAAETVPAAA